MTWILHIHKSYIISWKSTKLNGAQPPFTLVCLHRKNMEIWKWKLREWEERWIMNRSILLYEIKKYLKL